MCEADSPGCSTRSRPQTTRHCRPGWRIPILPVISIVDPRPLIRTTGAIQNTYALSLLQAETIAAAVTNDWPVRFADPSSAPEPVHRAADELGLDLTVIRA